MRESLKKTASIAGSLVLLAGMSAGTVSAYADQTAEASAADEKTCPVHQDAAVVTRQVIEHVQGVFAFTQDEISSNETIARSFAAAAKYLCGSSISNTESASLDAWALNVSGDVSNSFTASLDELAQEESATVVMGCSCSGNPADGAASINAKVTGVPLSNIMETAGLEDGVNTVVFQSTDGYETALPLAYVTQRYSLLVFNVNGEPLSDSVGGTNQLWLGATSARYFARDINAISFEKREVAPPAPGSAAGDHYANTPNAAIAAANAVDA